MKLSSARSLRSLAALCALCLLPLLAGCPAEEEESTADAGQVATPDSGTPTDAGDTTDAGQPLDAGTPDAGGPVEPGPGELGGVCATGSTCTAGDCTALPEDRGSFCTEACLENAECPDTLRCEAVSFDEMFCLFGARGAGAIGVPCGAGKGLGCASGICIDADPEEAIAVDTCTASCEGDADCLVPFPVCNPYFALCLPIGSGETGGICRAAGSATPCFDDNVCTELAGIGERCTITCTTAADCGADYLDCTEVAGTKYCVLKSGS